MKRRIGLLALLVALAAGVLAVSGAFAGKRDTGAPDHITIGYQPGIGYAPLILMKQQRAIESKYPGTTVTWRVFPSGTPITNGVVTGDIDIGAVGTGPFLVGWARGVNWKILSPLLNCDLWLMAKDPNIRTIADLKGKKIATPTNTSIQAVMLRKMAQVKLGDAHALDSSLVAMDHPDGMTALFSGQIDAHFTSPPFQFQEKVRGAHVVARSYQYFGGHTFLVTVAQQKFYDQYPQFARWFFNEILRQQALIKKNPDKAAHILQDDAGGIPTWRQFKQWEVNKAIKWTVKPYGLMRTAKFMSSTQQLTRMPGDWHDLVFPPVYATNGG